MVFIMPQWVNHTFEGLGVGFALARGGPAERVVALSFAAQFAMQRLAGPHYTGEMLGVDLACGLLDLGVLVAVMLRTQKLWPLVCCSISLVALSATITQLLRPVHGWAYGTVLLILEYLYLAVLAGGAWAHWRERRRSAPPPAEAIDPGAPEPANARRSS